MPYAVVACAVLFLWVISLRTYLATVLPTIAADLDLSVGLAGALISVLALGYCLAVWGVGFLPGSRKRRVLLGALFSLACAVAIALAPGPAAIFAAFLATGLGLGCYLPLGLAIIVEVSPPGRQARNMTLHELMATAGFVSGSGYVALALPALTWRQATLVWLLVGVVGCIAFALLRDAPQAARPRHAGEGTLRLNGTLLACVAVLAIAQLLVSGLGAVLPLIMVEVWRVGQGETAVVLGAARLAGPIGIAVAGLYGDRLGPANLTRVFFLLALACMAGLTLLAYGPALIATIFAMNVAASGGIMLASLAVAQVYRGPGRERALSVTSGVSGLLGMVAAPALFGYIVEQGLGQAPFVLMAIGLALASLLLGILARQSGTTAVPPVSGAAPASRRG